MTETTGTDKAPSEAPITPSEEDAGHGGVSGGETSPQSGAPETADESGKETE